MFSNILKGLFLKKRTELLVTTSKSILHVIPDIGEIREVHNGAGLYYGAAIDESGKHIYVMARNNADPFNYLSVEERAKEQSKILVLNRSLQIVDEFFPPHAITDFHQATFHKGKLWITCTILNAIYVYDFNSWEVWYPLEQEGKVGSDINHFNSISIIDNQIHIVAHNFGESEVLIFDIDSKELVKRVALGNCAHNVWYKNGTLWVCDSANQALISSNGNSVSLEGFTRGVAEFNDGFYIGSSGLSERSNRKDVDSQIHVLNANLEYQRSVPVEGFGQILEIRTL
ncbi:YncE family protein [Pseudoalteromonas sp. GB56]